MKVDSVCFVSVSGNLYSVFFMGLVGTSWDYPNRVLDNVASWRRHIPQGWVKGEIAHSRECKATA